MIKVNNLSFSYNSKEVLKNINIEFINHKITSIIGPNGSGKTTLLKNILKLLPINNNTIFIENKDLIEFSYLHLAKTVSYVSQYLTDNLDFTVFELVLMGRNPYIKRFKGETKKDLEIAEEAIKLVGIDSLRNSVFSKLSGGEKQKVIIAKAICQNTKYLILDEPLNHLDIHNQIEILNLIKELNINKNITIITVMHDINLASLYSDQIILLNHGKILDYGLPQEVITKENIKKVYKIDFEIIEHSKTKKPYLIHLG